MRLQAEGLREPVNFEATFFSPSCHLVRVFMIAR